MQPDEFEQLLRRQTFRPIPGEWRAEILAAARPAPRAPQPGLLSTLSSQLKTLLWPHPLAWGGLAAVWLVLMAINLAGDDKPSVVARQTAPPSPELILVLKEQRRELAQLIGPATTPEADKPKAFSPRPRSDRWGETGNA